MDWKREMQLFKFISGTVLGILTYGFINYGQGVNAGQMFLSVGIGVFVMFCVFFISSLLDKRIGWKSNTGYRLMVGIFLCAFSSILTVRVLYFQMEYETFLKTAILLLSYSVVFNIIYFIFYSYQEFASGHIDRQAFKTKQTQLQLDALKTQLSPHFLFNSLNALSALFHKNLSSAESFIRSLAKSYQYVLEQYENPLVLVKKEVAFTQSYFEMMKIRFGNGLSLSVDIDEADLSGRIPPLSLQMLVENAVKHNRLDTDTALCVRISSKNGYLNVRNNRILKKDSRTSTKLGLKNIAERFELLNSKSIRVEESDFFSVEIPILK